MVENVNLTSIQPPWAETETCDAAFGMDRVQVFYQGEYTKFTRETRSKIDAVINRYVDAHFHDNDCYMTTLKNDSRTFVTEQYPRMTIELWRFTGFDYKFVAKRATDYDYLGLASSEGCHSMRYYFEDFFEDRRKDFFPCLQSIVEKTLEKMADLPSSPIYVGKHEGIDSGKEKVIDFIENSGFLPPGRYAFEVKTKTHYDSWEGKPGGISLYAWHHRKDLIINICDGRCVFSLEEPTNLVASCKTLINFDSDVAFDNCLGEMETKRTEYGKTVKDSDLWSKLKAYF